jgi:hypothetical protein
MVVPHKIPKAKSNFKGLVPLEKIVNDIETSDLFQEVGDVSENQKEVLRYHNYSLFNNYDDECSFFVPVRGANKSTCIPSVKDGTHEELILVNKTKNEVVYFETWKGDKSTGIESGVKDLIAHYVVRYGKSVFFGELDLTFSPFVGSYNTRCSIDENYKINQPSIIRTKKPFGLNSEKVVPYMKLLTKGIDSFLF